MKVKMRVKMRSCEMFWKSVENEDGIIPIVHG